MSAHLSLPSMAWIRDTDPISSPLAKTDGPPTSIPVIKLFIGSKPSPWRLSVELIKIRVFGTSIQQDTRSSTKIHSWHGGMHSEIGVCLMELILTRLPSPMASLDTISASWGFFPGFLAETQELDWPEVVFLPALSPFKKGDRLAGDLFPIRDLRYYLSRTIISSPTDQSFCCKQMPGLTGYS